MNTDKHAKIVLVGDSGVGKSSIVTRITGGKFSSYTESTIGASFLTYTYQNGNRKVIMNIWDTAGQERYAALAPMYYRAADLALIVYDVNSVDSFERAKYWIRELQKNAPANMAHVLVGNKTDIENEVVAVPQSTADALVLNNGVNLHRRVSAKHNLGIDTLLEDIATLLHARQEQQHRQQANIEHDDLNAIVVSRPPLYTQWRSLC